MILSKNNNLIYFLIGLSSMFVINLIGTIILLEIIIIIIFFLNLKKNRFDIIEIKFLKLLSLLLLITFISNFYNEVEINKFSKGLANIFTFFILIIGIYNFFKNKDSSNFSFFFIGYLIGQVIGRFFFGLQEYFFINLWKWGLGYTLIIFSLFIIYIFNKKLSLFFYFLICLLFLSISIYFNSRWLSLIIITSFLFFLISQIKIFIFKNSLNYILSVVFVFLIIGSIPNLDVLKKISPEMYERNLLDNPYGKNQVIASRLNIISIKDIIINKPILGYGSYYEDEYMTINQKLTDYAYFNFWTENKITTDIISRLPTHSIILTSIAENGIFTLFVWIPFVSYIIQLTIKNTNHKNYLLFSFILLYFINYLMFQPLGYISRIELAPIIGLLLLKNKNNNTEKKS